nr:MAG TPA: hypothetical protein [Caudoviricetes sp.]
MIFFTYILYYFYAALSSVFMRFLEKFFNRVNAINRYIAFEHSLARFPNLIGIRPEDNLIPHFARNITDIEHSEFFHFNTSRVFSQPFLHLYYTI